MESKMKVATLSQMEELQYSQEYCNYIMENAGGDRAICNGHMLLDAQGDGYLFEEFLKSIGLETP